MAKKVTSPQPAATVGSARPTDDLPEYLQILNQIRQEFITMALDFGALTQAITALTSQVQQTHDLVQQLQQEAAQGAADQQTLDTLQGEVAALTEQLAALQGSSGGGGGTGGGTAPPTSPATAPAPAPAAARPTSQPFAPQGRPGGAPQLPQTGPGGRRIGGT